MTREQAVSVLQAKGVPLAPPEDHDYRAAKIAYDRWAGCTSKRRYESESGALGHIHKLKFTRQVPHMKWFDVYECPHCRGWHIATGLPR